MNTLTIEPQAVKSAKSARLLLLFIICFFSTAFSGVISTLMSVYLPVVVKDLQGVKTAAELNTISAYINSVFIFGWTAGGFFWGYLSDKIGRKLALLLSIACLGIFTMLTGVMPAWIGVMAARFFSGFGVGGILAVSVVLLTEVWPQKSRAVIIGIISIAFPVGIFSAGVINFFVSSWHEGFFVGALPILIAIIGVWTIEESVQWQHHRLSIADGTNQPESQFSPSSRKSLFIGSVIFGAMLIGMWALFSWMPTWIQSLITGDAPQQRGLSMMCMGMGGLAGGFLSGWIVNMAGLKRSLIVSFAVCAVMSFVLFKTNMHFSKVIYMEIALLAVSFGIGQGVLSVYIPSLFSTSVRAAATGFCFNIGRIFTGAAVLFIGVLEHLLGGYSNALFIFSLVFIIGLLCVIFIKDIEPNKQVNN